LSKYEVPRGRIFYGIEKVVRCVYRCIYLVSLVDAMNKPTYYGVQTSNRFKGKTSHVEKGALCNE